MVEGLVACGIGALGFVGLLLLVARALDAFGGPLWMGREEEKNREQEVGVGEGRGKRAPGVQTSLGSEVAPVSREQSTALPEAKLKLPKAMRPLAGEVDAMGLGRLSFLSKEETADSLFAST